MCWDSEYKENKAVWGEEPSELACFAEKYLEKTGYAKGDFSMVDLGCGYGRDLFYLCDRFSCNVLGVDESLEAIMIALDKCSPEDREKIQFMCGDMFKLDSRDSFDIVYASNMYQILSAENRKNFPGLVREILKPGGLLLISTLSTGDPQHYGKGTPVPDDENSFIDHKYLHLSTENEIRDKFSFLNIKYLKEHEYNEPRSNGEVHHHISWLLAGEYSK